MLLTALEAAKTLPASTPKSLITEENEESNKLAFGSHTNTKT